MTLCTRMCRSPQKNRNKNKNKENTLQLPTLPEIHDASYKEVKNNFIIILDAPKNSKTKAINRFVGEIATSIQK